MERVVALTSFDEEKQRNEALDYWLSRPAEERIAEVERLRREYYAALRQDEPDPLSQGLCRILRIIDRQEG